MRRHIVAVLLLASASYAEEKELFKPPPFHQIDHLDADPPHCQKGQFYQNDTTREVRACTAPNHWETVVDAEGRTKDRALRPALTNDQKLTIRDLQVALYRLADLQRQKSAELQELIKKLTPPGYQLLEDLTFTEQPKPMDNPRNEGK